MTDRPPADALLPAMLEYGRPKVAAHVRRDLLAEVRCPRRHLLAATVRTTGGAWVLWRGALQGAGWASGWLDEIADPAALYTCCTSCPGGMVWVVDVTDPARPGCNKPPALR